MKWFTRAFAVSAGVTSGFIMADILTHAALQTAVKTMKDREKE